MNISLIGGDERHARLAELFASDGHTVRIFGTDRNFFASGENGIAFPADAGDALADAEVLVLPLPVSPDGKKVNTPHFDGTLMLADVFSRVPRECAVFAGKVGGEVASLADKYAVVPEDYFAREELTVLNAAATAEAAIPILLDRRKRMIAGSRMLVIGFGRIGKLLALKLRSLGADVAVSARRAGDAAWIEALGMRPLDSRALGGKLSGYDAVINTVPHMMLDRVLLAELGAGCFCLDLASLPGGIDLDAAKAIGVQVERAPGLPGKTVPKSAAKIIRDTIYNMLAEKRGERPSL